MAEAVTLHASCVAWQGNGALITGRSGSGKSSLALALLAYGCTLVADDRTILMAEGGNLIAFCPDAIQGRIEARGVGILRAEAAPSARVVCVIDMDTAESERLPEDKTSEILGNSLRLFHNPATMAFPAAIMQYLRYAANTHGHS